MAKCMHFFFIICLSVLARDSNSLDECACVKIKSLTLKMGGAYFVSESIDMIDQFYIGTQ